MTYPSFGELRDSDIDAMAFIAAGKKAFAMLPELLAACAKYRDQSRSRRDTYFSYHLNFRMAVYERAYKFRPFEKRFHISGCMERDAETPNLRSAKYDIVVATGAEFSDGIERKLHFDYDAKIQGSDEPKPTSHLQFCGRLNDAHRDLGITNEEIERFRWTVDKPRIPCLPMSLAMVLQWIFLEYHFDPTGNQLPLDGGWRGSVRKAEHAILVPYFEAALASLRKTNADGCSCWATDFAYDGL